MSEPVNLEWIGKTLLAMQSEQRTILRESADNRTLLLALVDQGRRIERRVGELRDDIEVMVKAELMGRQGNFETRIERQIEELAERVAALEKPPP